MSVIRDTVAAVNRDLARIALPDGRLEAVQAEVNQLVAAIEVARARLEFDTEPADFVTVLTTRPALPDHG